MASKAKTDKIGTATKDFAGPGVEGQKGPEPEIIDPEPEPDTAVVRIDDVLKIQRAKGVRI